MQKNIEIKQIRSEYFAEKHEKTEFSNKFQKAFLSKYNTYQRWADCENFQS